MRVLLTIFYYLLHSLLWIAGILLCIGFLLLCIAAYGIPGKWLQPYFAAILPDNSLTLQVERIAYIPIQGIQITNLQLLNADKKPLVSFSKGTFGVKLFTTAHWEKRITHIYLDDLFVAQIEYDESVEPLRELPPPELRRPFPDLSDFPVPQFEDVELHFMRTDVLEIQLEELTGKLSGKGGILFFNDLKATLDLHEQNAEADVEVDIHQAVVKANIRGFLFQTRLNGIWHALDFPVIEKYSDCFTLKTPAWGDCSFVVGFDKFRNIFHLTVDIATKQGEYCGVPFDEANGTIVCHGIWDAVTTISPLVVRRNGAVAAQGKLIFDTVEDKFIFQAESELLHAKEALQIIDMPFTEVIPEIIGETPPHIRIQGDIPLLSEQTPEKVNLSAEIKLPDGGTLHGLPVTSATTEISMKEGNLSLNNFHATLSNQGIIRGDALFYIPNTAEYTDFSSLLYLENAPLSTLLTPLEITSIPANTTLTGFMDLACRTDETFANSLNAKYSITVHGGIITRIPLFAGLTDLIADNIPGISAITDSSTAKLIGTAENGTFSIPEFTLTGDLLSIEGPITYDLPNDSLLAQLMAGHFKQGSVLGYLTRWVTVPLNKLIWKIKVSGPLAEPDWRIVTTVEGLWNKALGKDPVKPAGTEPKSEH